MQTAPATELSPWRLVRRLGLIGLGLCLLLGAVLYALELSNRAQLRRDLQAIADSGEPVVLPPVVETEGGRATREWLRQFEDADEELSESHSCALLQDGIPSEQWDESERTFLAACELAYPRQQAALRGAIPTEPLDPGLIPGIERVPQHIPWLSSAVRAVLLPTHAQVARGEAREVSVRIQKALRLSSLYDRQVSQVALLARVHFRGRALAVARFALAQLPADAELESIDPLLAGIEDPRTQFHRALREERAIVNECFAQISSRLSSDQSYSLSTFAELLEISKSEAPLRIRERLAELSGRIDAHAHSWKKYTTPVSTFLIPNFTHSWEVLQGERAWIDLVRLALRVRHLAPQEALAEAVHSSDPFTGQAFHARIEASGLLALWSVGINGRDDGGPTQLQIEEKPELDDLVVRVRLR